MSLVAKCFSVFTMKTDWCVEVSIRAKSVKDMEMHKHSWDRCSRNGPKQKYRLLWTEPRVTGSKKRTTKLLPFSWVMVAPHNLLLIFRRAGLWEIRGHVPYPFCSWCPTAEPWLQHNRAAVRVCTAEDVFCQAVFLALGTCFLNHPYGFLGWLSNQECPCTRSHCLLLF